LGGHFAFQAMRFFQFVIDGKAKGPGLCNKPSILSTARTDEGFLILTRSQKKKSIAVVMLFFFQSESGE
jgi:hypothetical protein